MAEVVGLIPARGGSKGIPRKNLAALAGKPLLAYTAEAALAARCLHRCLLSTDSAEIAEVGRSQGLAVPFLRPDDLAGDEAPMLPVMLHALNWLAQQSIEVEALVLLQPTSPLRTSRHIDECVTRLFATGADTAVSVIAVPHHFNPTSVMISKEGFLHPFLSEPQPLRRQDKPRVFARNGPAVLAVRATTLRAGQLYGERVVGYEMTPAESLDIDAVDDLWLAEQMLTRGPS
jgi:CMP-N,N'-diacetyllegionaminic acid synthase